MSTTDTERYVRVTLLTFEGGTWISKEILLREVAKTAGSPTLAKLLGDKKDELDRKRNRMQITKRQYETLFPISGEDTDTDEWDLSLIIKIVLFLFESSLTKHERSDLSEILRIRNEVVCHAKHSSLTEQEYNTHWSVLTVSIYGLAFFDESTKDLASELVKKLSGARLDLHSSVDKLTQLCKNDEIVLEKLERQKEQLKAVATGDDELKTTLAEVVTVVNKLKQRHEEDEEDQWQRNIPINTDQFLQKAGHLGKYGTPSTESGRSGIDDLHCLQSHLVEKNTQVTHAYYTTPEHINIKKLITHDMHSATAHKLQRDLIEQEGTNCVEVFPAYRKCKDDPLFVVLTKENIKGESHLFRGFEIYRRGYEQVSPEAERVARHEGGAYLTPDDHDRVRKAIHSAELSEKHSNITGISVSPYKSKQNGNIIEKCVCIVIQCPLKGYIPIDEEEFPEQISGIPVDVREGYFKLGVKPPQCKGPKALSKYAPKKKSSHTKSLTGLDLPDNIHGSIVSDGAKNACNSLEGQAIAEETLNTRPTNTRKKEAIAEETSNAGPSTHLKKEAIAEETSKAGPSKKRKKETIAEETLNAGPSKKRKKETCQKTKSAKSEDSLFVLRTDKMTVEDPHVGLQSHDFNTRLLMGSCIKPSGECGSGTLGGFVVLDNGQLAALTCSHVIEGHDDILQPDNDEIINALSTERCLFGKVCGKVFDGGSMDKTGVDAATIEITNPDRIPEAAKFISVPKEQLKFAGFDVHAPPKFSKGQILKVDDIPDNHRRTSVLKFGAESGLTVGHLNLNGLYVCTMNREMEKLETTEKFQFFNQLEVLTIKGSSTNFFELGDSGSLLFMPLQGTELHCIGMCIGCTNYSCIVTPIENVFEKLKIKGFKNFSGGHTFL